jgi:tRNA(Leu) C34 or U34 (ribose-2'-O)-methylase TrmL
MRAAACYQAHEVRYTGGRFDRATRYHTDTNKARKTIPLVHVDDLLGNLPNDMKLVCVELVEGAKPLPTYEHPARALYLFGPEDGSIAQSLVDRADHVVYVPTEGCMNLAATVNVLLYDRLAKSKNDYQGDSIVISSRDVNNNLKVK